MASKVLTIFIIVSMVGLILSEISADNETISERKCVPGKEYHNGCNGCYCGPNGNNIICTKKLCILHDPNTNQDIQAPEIPAPDDFWQK
ncbi:PREDICTED: serine protease inhibitor 3-like [Wasmannia auropunctata]|uniref:serine protease inhibitor 3-like n=1 Tax=Wasmannia auropunctata TaxID=64793 RepID=UPI0005EF5DEA|nr:PREDICTED: serine protease inhibitor 3-like [Wasmannia auropunctata]